MTQHAFKPVLLDLLRETQMRQNAFFLQLPPAELTTIGTPEWWSAKDHVAHMTYWRQRLVLKLQAIIRQEPQMEGQAFQEMNPLIFAANQYRVWSDLFAESEQVYAELIALVAPLTEEDLTAFHRFDWIGDGEPLYIAFMGHCYDHSLSHLAQYLLDRHDHDHAQAMYESWTNRVVEAEVPETLKGYMLYNLACFYSVHGLLEQARPILQQAFVAYPATREYALIDPDLAALRSSSTD